MLKELRILIKPVSSACNLRCRYCFYRDESGRREMEDYGRMSRETAEILVERALGGAQTCTFSFQGGEPTLAGLSFFEEFVQMVEERQREGQEVFYSIQTNGWNLDERWIAFFRRKGFLVGISLDGVRNTHDRNRLDKAGRGTFEQVFHSVKKMQEAGVSLNVLCVLNRQTGERVDAVYRFFMRKGLRYQQYIPCLDPLEGPRGREEYSLSPGLYGKALKKLFDLWFEDRRRGVPVYIRQFDNYLKMLDRGQPESCGMYGRCTMQNVIEADGCVYPCDFYVLDPYEMGNIRDTDFESLQDRAWTEERGSFFENSSRRDDRCKDCRWYPLCRGGCRRDCLSENGENRNYYCEAYRGFFPYVIERMEWMVARGMV